MVIFPPASLSPEWLRVVGWPERDYQRTLGSNSNGTALQGDDLHWSKSGATRIDLPEFFASALLALPLRLDWNAFLTPASHEMHLEMLASAMASAETIMDLVRFELCNPWTPQTLPGRAGLLQESGFCAGLFYAPEDHESYIIAGEILTHQVIAGIGLDVTGPLKVTPPGNGEIGSIAAHALRMYSEALEAANETSRFVQLMSLIEFLAAPDEYVQMKKAKQMIARQIARDRADYDEIMQDFLYLSSEGGSSKGPKCGLRHNIVHCGKRLEDLADKTERIAVFKRLARYIGSIIEELLDHSDEDWDAIETLRSVAMAELGLTGGQAS
jgi:hypothetical protein